MKVQDLFALARSLRDAEGVGGVVLGVDEGDGARVAADGAVLPGAVLPWGSITKVVNAAAVVATGCDLEAYVHRGATLRHLLAHAGGLPANAVGDRAAVEPLIEPGRAFGYSNVGVLLAAESVGARLAAVLEPLGIVEQYSDSVPSVVRAAGGLAGPCSSLLAVARVLGGGEWSVLARPQVPAGSYAGAVGLGWFVDDLGGEILLRHEGRTPDAVAAVGVFRGVAMAAMVPDGAGGPSAWMGLRALMGARFGLDPDDARPQPDGSAFSVTGAFTTGGVDFAIDGDVLRWDGEHRLLGCGRGMGKIAEGPRAGTRIDVVADGLLRLDGRLAWAAAAADRGIRGR